MIYNKDNSLNSRFFTINKNNYEVIKTSIGSSKDVLEAVDVVRNNTNKNKKKMSRRELIQMLKNYDNK